MRKNLIELTAEQRSDLEALVRTGQATARSIQHAHILLNQIMVPLESSGRMPNCVKRMASVPRRWGECGSDFERKACRMRCNGDLSPNARRNAKSMGRWRLISLPCVVVLLPGTKPMESALTGRSVCGAGRGHGDERASESRNDSTHVKKTNSSRGSGSSGVCHVEEEANG